MFNFNYKFKIFFEEYMQNLAIFRKILGKY